MVTAKSKNAELILAFRRLMLSAMTFNLVIFWLIEQLLYWLLRVRNLRRSPQFRTLRIDQGLMAMIAKHEMFLNCSLIDPGKSR
ncbi:MAG TPA: hypothetical protein DEF79_05065 [Gammaproteobacteria bacterium]|nr:hypothetical protein [Gammaproteobacteria bacterium]